MLREKEKEKCLCLCQSLERNKKQEEEEEEEEEGAGGSFVDTCLWLWGRIHCFHMRICSFNMKYRVKKKKKVKTRRIH